MLDRIHKTAKEVHEKTGATISVELTAGSLNHISLVVYPAGWHEARRRADAGTASLEDWNVSRSSKHYNSLPANSEGQAEILEILEAML